MTTLNATPEQPCYTVTEVYGPPNHRSYAFNAYFEITGDKTRTTMSGTDDEGLAVKAADWCAKQPGVDHAYVLEYTDRYHHTLFYTTKSV